MKIVKKATTVPTPRCGPVWAKACKTLSAGN